MTNEELDELERLEKASRVGVMNETPGAMADAAHRLGEFVTAMRNTLPDLIAAARERDELRGKLSEMHRRAQAAEAVALQGIESGPGNRTLGRALANCAATKYAADLLATRWALKRAQASWWLSQEVTYSRRVPLGSDIGQPWADIEKIRMLRAVRLCRYFRTKFERESEELL